MKWLFIYAHMDDETISSYGLMKKLIHENNKVYLLTLCGNSRKNDQLKQYRYNVYKQNISFLTGWHCCKYKDLSLNYDIVKNEIERSFKYINPQCIVTHSICDNHFEHRLISNEILVQCRIKGQSYIKSLWHSFIPMNLQTYNQHGLFQPNTFIDISKYINDKKMALQKYADINEIPYDNNDIRSIQSCLNNNRQYGFLIGSNYAEAYQQIFKVI